MRAQHAVILGRNNSLFQAKACTFNEQ